MEEKKQTKCVLDGCGKEAVATIEDGETLKELPVCAEHLRELQGD